LRLGKPFFHFGVGERRARRGLAEAMTGWRHQPFRVNNDAARLAERTGFRVKTPFVAGDPGGLLFRALCHVLLRCRCRCRRWSSRACDGRPTDGDHTHIDFIREKGPDRTGFATGLRLTAKWTSSAKSVFLSEVQGSVAKATHAGLPWLRWIKMAVGREVHFWPLDGCKVP
jgi:hypothetical protein